MKKITNDPNQAIDDIFALQFSDEDLEGAAGGPHCFPTFTCGMPMCGTGGSCGTFPGMASKDNWS
jgi:hypothetical protein